MVVSYPTTQAPPAGITAAAVTSHPPTVLSAPPVSYDGSHHLSRFLAPFRAWYLAQRRRSPAPSLRAADHYIKAAQQAAQQAISQVLAQYPHAISAAGPAPPSLPGTFATLPPKTGPPSTSIPYLPPLSRGPLPKPSTPPPQFSHRLPSLSLRSTSPPLQPRSRCAHCSCHWPPSCQPPLTYPPRSWHWLPLVAPSPLSPPSLPQQHRSLNCCML